MKQLVLVLAGCTTLFACSGGREQRAPVTDKLAQRPDLTLPDTVSRTDTSVTVSSTDTSITVSTGTRQSAAADERPAPAVSSVKTKAAGLRHRRPATPTPKKQPEDRAVQAYAPGRARDTARDTASSSAEIRDSSAPDSGKTADTRPADSAVTPVHSVISPMETSPESTIASRPDTTVPAGTNAPSSHDSAAPRSSDSARMAETAAPKPPIDSNPAAAAAAAPMRSATATTAASRTLPAGTEIHAALDDSITSRRDTVGQQVTGHVMENVLGQDGRTLIPAGTPVRFTITQIRPSRSKGSQGRLALRADSIDLSGQLRAVQADLRPVPRELRGRGITGSEAAKVGGGAAAGAVVGGVVGNTKGAVIGGVAGAAAGAVVASQTATRDVTVKAKTPVVLMLTAPWVAP